MSLGWVVAERSTRVEGLGFKSLGVPHIGFRGLESRGSTGFESLGFKGLGVLQGFRVPLPPPGPCLVSQRVRFHSWSNRRVNLPQMFIIVRGSEVFGVA